MGPLPLNPSDAVTGEKGLLAHFLTFPLSQITSRAVLLTASCLMLFWAFPGYGIPSQSVRVTIIASKYISPYLQAVEGIQTGLAEKSDITIEVFNLEKLDDKSRLELLEEEGPRDVSLFVAVGPEAARYVWERIRSERAIRVYCMVLNPEKVINEKERGCGVPLNIPVEAQMKMISGGFPTLRRLGLLYDPEHNAGFLSKAEATAPLLNLTVVPLTVQSKKEIPSTLERQWNHMDALWLIPDRTVISESIVAYLVKEAFLRKLPVIGYNRFFYDAGAAMAFVFDYRELGRQCAQKILKILSGEACRDAPPLFHVWINGKVAERLGLRPSENYRPPLQLGP